MRSYVLSTSEAHRMTLWRKKGICRMSNDDTNSERDREWTALSNELTSGRPVSGIKGQPGKWLEDLLAEGLITPVQGDLALRFTDAWGGTFRQNLVWLG